MTILFSVFLQERRSVRSLWLGGFKENHTNTISKKHSKIIMEKDIFTQGKIWIATILYFMQEMYFWKTAVKIKILYITYLNKFRKVVIHRYNPLRRWQILL